MDYRRILLGFILGILSASCATAPKNSFIAAENGDTLELDHGFFKIAYNRDFRLAQYVTYTLRGSDLRKPQAKRHDKFIIDPLLAGRVVDPVHPKEYKGSGHDRGHLAPAADFSWSQKASDATFVMSNMAPQTPGLNRDAWRRLEERVRRMACGEDEVIVITGPVLRAGLPRMPSGLPIPQEFFKIIHDNTPPRKTLAFLYKQTDKGEVASKRVVALNPEFEAKIGIKLANIVPTVNEGHRVPASMADWNEEECR